MLAYLIISHNEVEMESGVVTVLYFFAKRKRGALKSFHDFWDTLGDFLLFLFTFFRFFVILYMEPFYDDSF